MMRKIENEKNKRAKAANEKNLAKSLARIAQYELVERKEAQKKDEEEKASFNLHSVIPRSDEPVTPAMSAESALAAEQAHKRLIMTDGHIALPIFRMVANNHFKPWQLLVMEDLDITDSRLGAEATMILASKFEEECHLVTLKAAGNHMGESGCCALLEGMRKGGAVDSLTYLDLGGNWLTIVADGLLCLGSLVNLTHLDLRNNHIAIDTTRHTSLVVEALSPLTKLQYLNLSQNRVQDQGFSALCNRILPTCELEVLDASDAFLTPASFNDMFNLVKLRKPASRPCTSRATSSGWRICQSSGTLLPCGPGVDRLERERNYVLYVNFTVAAVQVDTSVAIMFLSIISFRFLLYSLSA